MFIRVRYVYAHAFFLERRERDSICGILQPCDFLLKKPFLRNINISEENVNKFYLTTRHLDSCHLRTLLLYKSLKDILYISHITIILLYNNCIIIVFTNLILLYTL